MIICYTVAEIWRVTDVIVIFHFGLFFALLPSESPKYQNFSKNEKNTWRFIILHMCTENYQMMYGSWDMVRNGQMERGMDGETDGWMAIWIEKVIYRGGCPIKKIWSEFLMRNIFKWLILSKWTDRTSDDLNGHHVAGSPVTIHCWIASRIF